VATIFVFFGHRPGRFFESSEQDLQFFRTAFLNLLTGFWKSSGRNFGNKLEPILYVFW